MNTPNELTAAVSMVTTDHMAAAQANIFLAPYLSTRYPAGRLAIAYGHENAESNKPMWIVLKSSSLAIVVLAMLSVFRSR